MDLVGLSGEEVRDRVSEGKVNRFESPVSRGYLDIIVKNVCTTFNLILFILGVVLLYFEEPISALSATGVIALNILISTVQEIRAKMRLDKIALLLRPTVRAVRDGSETEIDPSEIVMDDLIHLKSGDQAQVDGELVHAVSLEMDESLLTGESSTRRKRTGDTIHSGAFCVTGDGYYRVTALGEDTFASQMLSSAKKYKRKNTPLQRETSTVTKMLMVMAFVFLLILAVANTLGGDGAKLFAIKSVLVLDIVPIALFLLITITYMIAAVRMANSGVLLQNSNSVESMSHVNTVCMDKTGTITTNNLIYDGMEMFVGEDEVREAIRLFVSSTGSKNRTVKALERVFGNEEFDLIEEVQFSSDRKYSAVRVTSNGSSKTIFVGAWPSLRDHIAGTDISADISDLSRKGLRTVILCKGPDSPLYLNDEPVIPDLGLMALIAIRDEVRPDCRDIIEEFQKNGMEIKVISGDDPETVDALFSLAEIPGERKIISGDMLEMMSEEDFDDAVLETNIFGRMKPEQKEMVVESLKGNGRYVAMVGDGVNDVRSIKAANVGVALQSGSGAARGVADMVLVNDQFSALPRAITEGKRTVTGMRDILRLYLTRNFVLAVLVGVLLLALGRLPMLPVHNTFYALVSVSFAAFLMAIWAKPSDNTALILPGVLRFSIPMAVLITAFGLAVYALFLHGTGSGLFDLGESFYRTVYEGFDTSEWNDWGEFMKHMSFGNESFEDITARNAMLVFLMLSGISQLFFIYPMFRFYSINGEVPKDIKPTILALLLFGLVALVYNIPQIAVGIASLAVFPMEYYALIAGFVVIWFFFTVFLLKNRFVQSISYATESAYRKSLEAEIRKEK
ncbi:MAG: HAD-IC family P-type ATPase [Candidatus Methanoplasma sp.]|jgi:cation-transporting ATPase E|nr:HAD-IC family P-type ATPase [Candidatus Methanoplasma sp.]